MAEINNGDAPGARHRRRRLRTCALGFGVLALAAVGAAALITTGVRAGVRFLSAHRSPAAPDAAFFEKYIAPVVMQNPAPFSDPGRLKQEFVIKTAVWAALNDAGNNAGFSYTADNHEILPLDTIAAEVKKLFGNAVTLQYRSFTDGGAFYEYRPAERCYDIPMISLDNLYSPKITAIKREKGSVTLTVEILPGSGWMQSSDGGISAPTAVRTMKYRLIGSGTVFRIAAVTAVPQAASCCGSQSAQSGAAVVSAPPSTPSAASNYGD